MTKRDIVYFFFKWKASILSLFILVVSSVTLFVYVMPPSYTGKAKVLVEPNRAPAMRTDFSPGLNPVEVSFTEVEIILSHVVMSEVVDKLKPHLRPPKEETFVASVIKGIKTSLKEWGLIFDKEPRDRWISYLLDHVKVERVESSNILEVIFKDKNPEWAAKIVNQTVDSYIRHHFEVYMSHESSELYREPMERSEKIVASKRQKLIEFKKKYSVAALKEKKLGLAQSMASLREKLTNVNVNLAELKIRYKPGHPGYQEVLLLETKTRQLKSSETEANNQLKELEVKIDRVDTLEQEIMSQIKTYEDHKKKFEDARVNELSNLNFINVRVVDYSPVPVAPEYPRLFFIAISIVVGFIFAITIALIKEYFDRRISDPEEVEQILGIPEMGSLEKFGSHYQHKVPS